MTSQRILLLCAILCGICVQGSSAADLNSESAATRIQKHFRGFQARQKLKVKCPICLDCITQNEAVNPCPNPHESEGFCRDCFEGLVQHHAGRLLHGEALGCPLCSEPLTLNMLQDKGLGLQLNEHYENGETALIHAVRTRNVQAVAVLLLNRDADVDHQDNNGLNALMEATLAGSTEIVEFLLNRGANVNLWDMSGHTALMISSGDGRTEIVELLLNRGDINVNLQNNRGHTALMYATMFGRTEIVELLLNRGADEDLRNNDGHTALDIAQGFQAGIDAEMNDFLNHHETPPVANYHEDDIHENFNAFLNNHEEPPVADNHEAGIVPGSRRV